MLNLIRPGPCLKVLAVAAQLALVAWVVQRFRLESPAFLRLLILTLVGFLVHSALPVGLRLRFFLLLSLTGLVVVLGLADALVLLGLGLVLIGLCHLPAGPSPWKWRYAALLLTGGLLAWARSGGLDLGLSTAVWPILGSMFMFRLIIYLYDLRRSELEPSATWTLSYFFLLPNVCFPLFPVVDYRTLRRTYYDTSAGEIHQRGVAWIFLGVCELILYRLVYSHLSPDPVELSGTGDVLLHVVSSYLLILRVVGQFHIIVGMLLLFGFNLPPIFSRMFFAEGFSDFWRRANIYWKDFMLKIVFYPSFMRWRSRPTIALVLGTALVFFTSWGLHAYQWFWLTGSLILAWNDIAFWSCMGLLVLLNVVWEDRRGARRERPRATVRRIARWLRIVATFTTVSLLFSLWSADSLAQWVDLWSSHPEAGGAILLLIALAVTASFVVEALGRRNATGAAEPRVVRGRRPDRKRSFWRRATLVAVGTVTLLVAGTPRVYQQLGPGPTEIVESVRDARLRGRDLRAKVRGYYENMLAVNVRNFQLRERYYGMPADWEVLSETDAYRRAPGEPVSEELVPGKHEFRGKSFTINRWGMRDQEYSRAKPAGVIRMALVDASTAMGAGVADGETFEALYEERLNARSADRSFEVLNLAIGGSDLLADLEVLRHRAFSFDVDAALVAVHSQEPDRIIPRIRRGLRRNPDLEQLLPKGVLDDEPTREVLERRLGPHRWQVFRWTLDRMVEECEERGIVPVFVLLPMTEDDTEERIARVLDAAAAAGFHVVDLTGTLEGFPLDDVRVALWDGHPNAFGHQLIAEGLYDALGLDRLDELLSGRHEPTAPANGR